MQFQKSNQDTYCIRVNPTCLQDAATHFEPGTLIRCDIWPEIGLNPSCWIGAPCQISKQKISSQKLKFYDKK